jgi:D-tyrosyl-tRNA(Tyr) deacylase
MRAVLQRVSEARVEVGERVAGAIGLGLLVLLGVEKGDTEADASYLAGKIAHLRIFRDAQDKMNLSVTDAGGSILCVSQFTLLASVEKGRRPAFDSAAPPAEARRLYDYFVSKMRETGLHVATGEFQADMKVHLVNDGPVTIVADSRRS